MLLSSLLSWVGYSETNFEGQQYVLEEGQFPQSSHWGGADSRILSLRPVCTVGAAAPDDDRRQAGLCSYISNQLRLCLRPPQEFMSPHVKLFSEPNFHSVGLSVDLMGPVVNMDEVAYSHKTQSVNVMSGV